MIITSENKFCYVPACYKSELRFSSRSVIENMFTLKNSPNTFFLELSTGSYQESSFLLSRLYNIKHWVNSIQQGKQHA